MIALGIDPGTATTGYGVIKKEGDNFICLEYGTIETDKNSPTASRLFDLHEKLSFLIKKYSPDLFAVESLFFFKNLKTALPVSQSKGVILLTAEMAKLPIYEFTPLQVKMAVTGYGKADKKQVQEMIKVTLNLEEYPRPDDAADALGVALCAILKESSPY
jgi:crossover junction endodeoxyribonuclease RuvC